MPMKYDFKAIAESVDITSVTDDQGITLKANRAPCPACKTDDERSLQIYPDTNSFTCWASKVSGDCISLWAHLHGYSGMYRAAKEVSDKFLSLPGHVEPVQQVARGTPPQKPQGRTAPAAQPPAAFDPAAYLDKLQYTQEVADLGISEAEARALGIGHSSTGLHKGLAFALRYESGAIAGFCSVIGGQVKLPKRLIPDTSTVVPFKRPA